MSKRLNSEAVMTSRQSPQKDLATFKNINLIENLQNLNALKLTNSLDYFKIMRTNSGRSLIKPLNLIFNGNISSLNHKVMPKRVTLNFKPLHMSSS